MTKPAGSSSEGSTTLWQAICASKRGLDPALTIPERLVFPDSWAGHLPFAAWIMAVSEPRRFVELGVHTGNSYCTFAQSVMKYQLNTECFGIDHWFGDEQAGLYGEDVYADLKSWHDPRFGHFSRLLRMSFANGLAHIDDGSVDLLHIDGLHTYEAVREDFETYLPKMSDRCIVLFHDTNVYREDFGVWQYFQEIKAKYPTFEFLHSNGLGVAYTGSQPLETLDPLLAQLFGIGKDGTSTATVRNLFSLLGDAHIRAIRLDDKQRWGEGFVAQLHEANLELGAVARDRAALLEEQQGLKQKALKWDQLAVSTGGSISLDLDEIKDALNLLFNSGNPQALQDRAILKRQLANLIGTGTINAGFNDLAIWTAKRLKAKLAGRLKRTPVVEKDPAIEKIRASGLFDETFYALTDQARSAGQDPLEHYLQTGEDQRQAPSPFFDPDYYARRNPDVARTRYGLLRHYVLNGQAEGRACLTPAKRLVFPAMPETGRPRVLLLLAPDLQREAQAFTRDLIRHLQMEREIIAVCEPGDPQIPALSELGATVIELPAEKQMLAVDRNELMAKIVADSGAEMAISPSLRTRINVRGLAAAGLGVVQLVDDFSPSVRPYGSAYEFLPWAHRLVFPSNTVAASFESEHAYLSRRQKDILPLPAFEESEGRETAPDPLLSKQIRPDSEKSALVIAGAGDLELQSGIETFLALAVKAGATSPNGRALNFVWLTNRKAGEDAYARVVGEQIRRAGLEGRCRIVCAGSAIEAGIQLTDAFALTAPIEGLSHVAATAARAGKPVLCFENGSSLGEILSQASDQAVSGLAVPYLDLDALVASLHRLADTSGSCEAAGKACAELAKDHFGFSAYTAKLVQLGLQAKADADQISEDYALISKVSPPVFNEDVYAGSNPADKYPQDRLHSYLLRGRVSTLASLKKMPTDLRRPFAGFSPLIYFEDCMQPDCLRDPLAGWLEKGKPDGRWTHHVIALQGQKPAAAATSALLHGHFYYVDLIDEFLERLCSNASKIDVVITVPDEDRAVAAREALSRAELPGKAWVEVVRNAGRDIGPFLSGLDREILQKYEVIGHIHGKKSPHVEASTGDAWRNFLFEHLIGGKNAAADACLAAFDADPELGLVFPEDPHLVGWDKNGEIGAELVKKMGWTGPLPRAFDWPVGTMFWAREAALKPLFDLDLGWDDYPLEPLPEDGTLLHAIERVMPFAVQQAGFGYATTHTPEVLR